MYAADAAFNGTELWIEPTPELPRSLLGDGGKVKQILINLVSNATKFTRQGSIRITATWTLSRTPQHESRSSSPTRG